MAVPERRASLAHHLEGPQPVAGQAQPVLATAQHQGLRRQQGLRAELQEAGTALQRHGGRLVQPARGQLEAGWQAAEAELLGAFKRMIENPMGMLV